MDQQEPMDPNNAIPDDAVNAAAALRAKLTDILVPGYEVEFDPDEAEQAGAFKEGALSLQDAAESCLDLLDPSVSADSGEEAS